MVNLDIPTWEIHLHNSEGRKGNLGNTNETLLGTFSANLLNQNLDIQEEDSKVQ